MIHPQTKAHLTAVRPLWVLPAIALAPLVVASGSGNDLAGPPLVGPGLRSAILAAYGAAFVIVGVAILLPTGLRRFRDLSSIRAALSGSIPRSGRHTAFLGVLDTRAQPLAAPISARRCVAFEVHFCHSRNHGPTGPSRHRKAQAVSWRIETFHYSGYHMVPTEVRSSGRSVRLLGFPVMVGAPTTSADLRQKDRRAREWLGSTRFDRVKSLRPALERLHGECDGVVDEDWSLRDPPSDPDALGAEETILPVKAEVCATGIYDEKRGALVPGPGRRNPIRVFCGSGEQATASLQKSGTAFVASGALAMLAGLALVTNSFL